MKDIYETIYFKIFLRFLKEHNMISVFNKVNNGQYHDMLNKISADNNISFSIFVFIRANIGINTENRIYIDIFNRFCNNYVYYQQFNRIITYKFNNILKEFLIEKNLFNIFIHNVCNHNERFKHEYPYIEEEQKDINNIFDIYIDFFVKLGWSFTSIIDRAFMWADTKEKTEFWARLNNVFYDRIKEVLLK